MIEYIYFVKCPNCEDEPFSFFDEAQHYALGCLSNKPIITQVEVDRDDFGCCTDSRDLGTVWSYDNIMDSDLSVAEPAEPAEPMMFSKSETFDLSDDELFSEFDDEEFTIEDDDDIEISIEDDEDDDDDEDIVITIEDDENTSIDIKSLVEMMEENEDTVECKWCEDLFDKSECRYEVNLGYLCSRCEAAIKSRGETLTFRENNYWDFLDEDASQKDTDLNESYDYNNFARLEPNEIAKAKLDILLDLYCDSFASDYIDLTNNTIKVPFMIDSYSATTGKKDGYKTTGKIIDFSLEGNRIMLTLDGGAKQDLEGAFKVASKGSITRKFLDVFEPIVRQVNRKYRMAPTVLFERDLITTFRENPQFANVLAKYITDITFTVPLINESPYDVEFAKAVFADGVELDSEEGDTARKHLENLCNKFFDKPFAKKAFDLGKVINRPIKASDKSYHVNPQSWGNGCEITLSCPVATLEKEAPGIKNLINDSKTVKDNANIREVQDSDTSIKSFNLASALIQYFDNNVEFYNQVNANANANANAKLSYTVVDDDKELATV